MFCNIVGPPANMQIFPPNLGNNAKGYQTLESPTGKNTPFGHFLGHIFSVVTINPVSHKNLLCRQHVVVLTLNCSLC